MLTSALRSMTIAALLAAALSAAGCATAHHGVHGPTAHAAPPAHHGSADHGRTALERHPRLPF